MYNICDTKIQEKEHLSENANELQRSINPQSLSEGALEKTGFSVPAASLLLEQEIREITSGITQVGTIKGDAQNANSGWGIPAIVLHEFQNDTMISSDSAALIYN